MWTSVILAGKRGSRRQSTDEFLRECCSGGNKLSNVITFIFLPLGEVLISINTDNSCNFSGAKKVQWSFPGCLFFIIREKTLIQISSSNLKLSNPNPMRLWRSCCRRRDRRDLLNHLFSDSSFQKYIPYNKTFHGWPVTDWWIFVGSTEVDLAH